MDDAPAGITVDLPAAWDRIQALEDDIDNRRVLERLLPLLKPRERFVIDRRFGLNGDPEMTLEAVGREMGISRERVRQLEQKGLRRLRLSRALPAADRQLLCPDPPPRCQRLPMPAPPRPPRLMLGGEFVDQIRMMLAAIRALPPLPPAPFVPPPVQRPERDPYQIWLAHTGAGRGSHPS